MQIPKNPSTGKETFFIQQARQLIENYQEDFARPKIVVGGCLNTGKTTLVNSLLQNNPAFQLNTPCPVFYTHGTKFMAKLWTKERLWYLADPRELTYALKTRHSRLKPEKVEVTLNHRLLKLCHLVDTPGVDSPVWEHSSVLEQIFADAGQIIYLFHQRGIQICDRHFLQKLKELLGQNSYRALSFWLNCNAGQPDGTSLASTRAALRELFGAQIPVHTLNTRDQASISALGVFLQEKLIEDVFSQIEGHLRQEDSLLPEMLAKLSVLPGEPDFLLNFWLIKEKAGRILAFKQAINELRKQKTVNAVLAENNRRILQKAPLSGAGRPETGKHYGFRKHLAIGPENLLKLPPASPEKFVVTAWGPFSSGKSTFFNAIMKEAILPAEDKPTTSYLTRLHYGPEKIAVAYFPRQLTLDIWEPGKGKGSFKREETNVLCQYLTEEESVPQITGIEVAIKGRYQKTTKQELVNRLMETRALLLTPSHLQKNLQKNGVVTAVRLTFKQAAHLIFHLEREREEFHHLLTGPLNFFLEAVDIYHPAEFFKLATFLDTPGIDSVFAQHRQTCLKALSESSLLLVFIHGKQLISAPYQKEVWENVAGRVGHLAKAGRVLFLINFADTLTALERERAANFVRRQLTSFLPNPPLFLVSSLAALNGRDGGFEKVLRRIQEIISTMERRSFDYGKRQAFR